MWWCRKATACICTAVSQPTPHQSPAVTASPQGEALVAIPVLLCYNSPNESEGFVCTRFFLSATAGFPRISKSPCASKEIRFPKLHLPTVYQRNRRAKLAVNTQTPVHGRFCHRTGVLLIYFMQKLSQDTFLSILSQEIAKVS